MPLLLSTSIGYVFDGFAWNTGTLDIGLRRTGVVDESSKGDKITTLKELRSTIPGERTGNSVKRDVCLSVICYIYGRSFLNYHIGKKKVFLKEHIAAKKEKKQKGRIETYSNIK